jgi:aspartyl-tRNA(Asn)/glutamyl-tRNA(Gln) amidotransferase subunit A
MVFGFRESAGERAAALVRYVGPTVAPALPGGALVASAQPDSAAPSTAERRSPEGEELVVEPAGWSDALTQAQEIKLKFGAFTYVPDPLGAMPSDLGAEATGGLAGVPVAVKDNMAVRGMPLSAGSAVMVGNIAERDAVVVERLRDAGAWVIGKAALDEFAFGTLGPGILNPAFPGLTVGGSSGGSAVAVAAGACPVALGTDTGGSVRIPAACTGVVGFKPTAGWVSNDGVIPLSWSLDTVGIFGTSVDGVATAYDAIAGAGPRAPYPSRSLEELRLAMPDEDYLRVAEDAVLGEFASTCTTLGGAVAGLEAVPLPDSDHSLNVQYLVVLAESASYHRGRWGADRVGYSDGVRIALERGDAVRASDYLVAQRARSAMRKQVEQVLARHDVLILPTMAIDPPPVGVDEVTIGDDRIEDTVSAMLRFTALFNHVGFPAISLPLVTADGVPRGLQVVGRPGEDAELLGVARLIAGILGC